MAVKDVVIEASKSLYATVATDRVLNIKSSLIMMFIYLLIKSKVFTIM